MSTRLVLLTLAIAPLAACSAEMDREPDIRAPAATVVGEAVNCIQASNIRYTMVRDDHTIDFEMRDGQTYRNTLPNRCPTLGFEERFTYELRTTQLCNVDTITVLDFDGKRGATCGLGKFVPVEIVKADAG